MTSKIIESVDNVSMEKGSHTNKNPVKFNDYVNRKSLSYEGGK